MADITNPFLAWRRNGTREIHTREVRGLSPDAVKRIEILEQHHLQTMQALQVVLQALEDERAQRELIKDKLISLGEWADERLRKSA